MPSTVLLAGAVSVAVLGPLAGLGPASHRARPTASGPSVIVSPAPHSATASATTEISFLGVAPGAIGAVSVTGSVTGRDAGHLRAYSTGNGASLVLDHPLRPGEQVVVHTGLDVAGATGGTWSFRIGRRVAVPVVTRPAPLPPQTAGVLHFASAPGLEPPAVTVTTGASSAGGDFFLAPKGAVGTAGPMIVDGAGHLVWFDQLKSGRAFDLNVQHLGTAPVLTWFQGTVVDAHGVGEDVIADRSYRPIAVLSGANGFQPDLHEFVLLRSGVALVTSYQALRWNTAPDGGSANGTVWDGIVQEIDVRTGLVEYEWHSLDHVPVSSSVFRAPRSPAARFDYFHVNSIQQLPNGDLLVSARNTSAAYEISPAHGGAVVFELGGKHASFTMGPGTSFSLQHDVEELPGDVFTIFNDASPPAPSQALVLHLDTASSTVSLVRAIEHTPAVPAAALGNVQTLRGGNLVVSWGTSPDFSEYRSDGTTVLDAHLPVGDDTYRVYQHHWSGQPASPPAIVVSAGPGSAVTAHLSWNGATGVRRWQLLTGSAPAALHRVASVAWRGFETSVVVAHPGRLIEAQAVAASGKVLASSAAVAAS